MTVQTQLATRSTRADTGVRVGPVVFPADGEDLGLDISAESSGDKHEQSSKLCEVSAEVMLICMGMIARRNERLSRERR